MKIFMIISFALSALILLGTFMLLIIKTKILKKVYEELYTHPESTKTIRFFAEIIADMFYIVGGSSVASSVFMAITTGELSVKAFTYGLALAIIGKYLKEEKKV